LKIGSAFANYQMATTPPRRQPDAASFKDTTPQPKRVSPKLPIPISIELHNPLPKIRIPQKKWFRPEYNLDLLRTIRLEITVAASAERKPLQQREIPLYSSIHSRMTQSPVWQHLEDSISYIDLAVEEYESLTARFYAADDTVSEGENGTKPRDRNHCFLETSLHPSKLCRIARLPLHFPLNCAVIRFSDQSLRIHPADYQLLLKGDLVAPGGAGTATANSALHRASATPPAEGKLDKRLFAFDDETFITLDSPPPASVGTPVRDVVSEAMNVFKDLSMTNLLSDDMNEEPLENGHVTPDSPCRNGDFDGGAALFSTDDAVGETYEQNGSSSQTEASKDLDAFIRECLAVENGSLEQLIEIERLALEQEREAFQQRKGDLLLLTEALKEKNEQFGTIEAVVQEQEAKVAEMTFVLEAERIRLIQDLSTIYPITVEAEQHYFIRGLRIPSELYSGSYVADDVTSAALGFLSHLVFLLSKYLGVHLRYKIICQSSRSAIQDEYGATYPLFLGRPAERENVEYAVHLLGRNIDCLCRARGIRLTLRLHVLAKVMRIYEHFIDGY
jgi:Vacuolar sorting 38 and autophagy-related subunit 14